MRWCRLYAEFATDPKVQVLSEAMQRRLVMLFCLHATGEIDGLTDREIAFHLRISLPSLLKTKQEFVERGFINDGWHLVNWEKRQFVSDRSVERVRNYRKRLDSVGGGNGYEQHRVTVTERDGNCCVYCGSPKNLCIDHMVPLLSGGDNEIDNLVLACKQCNSGKSGRTPEQAGYGFWNKSTISQYQSAKLRLGRKNVTVTVTGPDTDTDTDTEKKTTSARNRKQNGSMLFDFATRKWSGIEQADMEMWTEAYPAVNLQAQIAKAADWLVSNPDKKKKNYRRFLSGWFSRCQEKGGDTKSNPIQSEQSPRYYRPPKHIQEMLDNEDT